MVGITLTFPTIVTHYKQDNGVNPGDINIQLPPLQGPGGGLNFGTPGGDSGNGGSGGSAPGGFTVPPPPKF